MDKPGKAADAALIIVKRPRLRVKRPRKQHQRTIYVTQQQQPAEPQTVQLDKSVEPVPHADAKVVHTRKSHVQYGSPHGAPIATQANGNPVGLALDIPIGILRSLQQSIGALVAGQPAVQQPYQG